MIQIILILCVYVWYIVFFLRIIYLCHCHLESTQLPDLWPTVIIIAQPAQWRSWWRSSASPKKRPSEGMLTKSPVVVVSWHHENHGRWGTSSENIWKTVTHSRGKLRLRVSKFHILFVGWNLSFLVDEIAADPSKGILCVGDGSRWSKYKMGPPG